ncbi:universal stress protein [Inhella gelatinilytica]|uniref:Universal stress protein n=1 Tax=Inhella gelatinilytica TaxID=2795030 RepID=A0A931IT31_9BURK|nr:universal stress protein [Inhella gelatinilytica]MBH9551487.1 universal stress protein [Inhella gelatinilytica]
MTIKRLMVVLELTPWSASAVQQGLALAGALAAELVFFVPLPALGSAMGDAFTLMVESGETTDAALRLEAAERLRQAAEAADHAGILHHVAVQRGGDLSSLVVEQARRWHCAYILVGAPPQNAVMRLLSGNLIPALITASPIPVLVCKDEQ